MLLHPLLEVGHAAGPAPGKQIQILNSEIVAAQTDHVL